MKNCIYENCIYEIHEICSLYISKFKNLILRGLVQYPRAKALALHSLESHMGACSNPRSLASHLALCL